jgi:cell division protein FtsB
MGVGSVGRWMGRAVKALLAPALLLGLSGFFVWHAQHGERGLMTYQALEIELAEARRALAAAREEREAAERRVNALRGQQLDRDQLEERARAMLNLTHPQEIVIPYPPGQRLF